MRRHRLLSLALLATVFVRSSKPADPAFIFEARALEPYTAAYLGNGAISLVTTPLATDAARTFVAGLYDETPGDVPRIASAPAWNEVDVYNGTHWLNQAQHSSTIERYQQTLDMHDGVLRTTYRWNDANKPIAFHIDQFVSRDNPHLAAVTVTVKPEFTGNLEVRLPLRNWPAPHRYDLARIRKLDPEAQQDPWKIWYPGWLRIEMPPAASVPANDLSLLAAAPGAAVKVGEAVALAFPPEAKTESHASPEAAEIQLRINVTANRSYTFRKFVAIIASSSDNNVREHAIRESEAARSAGWSKLLTASVQAWHKLWESDIVVEGNPALQRDIHAALFYLLASAKGADARHQATKEHASSSGDALDTAPVLRELFENSREDLDISIGPMGLSSAGYYGHIFWDADIFMFPALVILHPELARPIVAFRSRTLPAAVENARKNGFRGAMYPWEAGPNGRESTPMFAFQNATSEIHVTGDVALAAWQYWLATADQTWLKNNCWPVLRDTADFWVSRVSFDKARGQYFIGKVVSVNESEIGVSNDPYTNAVAQKNLQIATAAANLVHAQADPKWKDVAEKMYVPESDSSLLWYPLDRPYSNQQARNAIEAMLSRIRNHRSGAMMGTEFYPILAAQISDRSAIGQLLPQLSAPYLRPPFQVIAETPLNQNTNFITGAGAFLQQFVFGYTGLRLTGNGLERRFPPTLPPGITRLTLKNISIRGQRQSLTF